MSTQGNSLHRNNKITHNLQSFLLLPIHVHREIVQQQQLRLEDKNHGLPFLHKSSTQQSAGGRREFWRETGTHTFLKNPPKSPCLTNPGLQSASVVKMLISSAVKPIEKAICAKKGGGHRRVTATKNGFWGRHNQRNDRTSESLIESS